MKIRQIIMRLSMALITLIIGVSAVLIWLNYFAVEMSEHSPVTVENTPVPGEDYDVYSAVLAEKYNNDVIVIGDCTSHFKADIPDWEPPWTEDTAGDYWLKNKTNQKLSNFFNVRGLALMLSEKEENEIFQKAETGWKRFYQKYPTAKGIVYFSRVGYNLNHTQALVYFTHQSAKVAGEDGFIFLEKKKGVWIPKSLGNYYISD